MLPIGSPTPGDPDTFRFVALDTKTPCALNFDAADGWKNVHYLLRRVNSTGEKGLWTEAATVSVGA